MGATDGRLYVTDTTPSERFPIYCRGNVGEVFPNVMTPMTSSLFQDAASGGQERTLLEFGMVSAEHFVGADSVLTGVFGGYLYGNVSLGRVASARVPGLSAADIDREMFGLSDAPPPVRQRGDRDLRGSARAARQMTRALFRPRSAAAPATAARAEVAAWRAALPPIESSDQETLIDLAAGVSPWVERMMYHLLFVSAFSGLTRSTVERLVARFDEPGLVNTLSAGLGTIESARPANELWRLGRLVAASPTLTALFDDDSPGLSTRVRAERRAEGFNAGFDAFLEAHGARGPDEWELASPTWGDRPEIALAAIDRLRWPPPTAIRAAPRIACAMSASGASQRSAGGCGSASVRSSRVPCDRRRCSPPSERRRRLRSCAPCSRGSRHLPNSPAERMSRMTTCSSSRSTSCLSCSPTRPR